MTTPNSKVIIVGAGVFGLSTALWLARAGYKDVTVFDRSEFDKTNYNPANGNDGASSDINKIFRMTYGEKSWYEELAIEARDEWLRWNEAIRKSKPSDLPPSLSPEDKLLDICGLYHLADGKDQLHERYVNHLAATQKTSPKFREMQFVKGLAGEDERIKKLGKVWEKKYHVLDTFGNGNTNGFLDTAAGLTLADKACTYAYHLCKKEGVKFVFGDKKGRLQDLIRTKNGSEKKVTGIKTCDGLTHSADVVIVACGPWTPAVIPEAHKTVEATMGTVMFIDVPEHRQDLRQKFHPDNMPIWRFLQGEGDNFYEGGGFPITREGRLKFGFRARKFTNFQDHPSVPNLRISTPRTKYSPDPINTVPLHGLRLMKKVIGSAFPELAEIGFTDSRLCWYTDSIDNDFVIDYVPGYSDSLFICTGGSGHAFKFLPTLGKYVRNQLERKPDHLTEHWKWRAVEEGKPANGLEEGESGPREMSKLDLASPSDFKFTIPNKL
ncbi:hypothetical protein VUR80DRAFT_122 [Thermomyces stellatus]